MKEFAELIFNVTSTFLIIFLMCATLTMLLELAISAFFLRSFKNWFIMRAVEKKYGIKVVASPAVGLFGSSSGSWSMGGKGPYRNGLVRVDTKKREYMAIFWHEIGHMMQNRIYTRRYNKGELSLPGMLVTHDMFTADLFTFLHGHGVGKFHQELFASRFAKKIMVRKKQWRQSAADFLVEAFSTYTEDDIKKLPTERDFYKAVCALNKAKEKFGQ